MNIFLWVLQILLALHTATGAVWKFSNSEKSIPSLKALPHGAWLALAVLEFFFALGLIVPVVEPMGILAPIAAACVAAEMLLFCALHLRSGHADHGSMVYWLVVAAISSFIAYGRFVLEPF